MNIEYGTEELDKLKDKLLDQEEEIERLNNIIKQKDNILKEAIEYIKDRYDGEVLTHTFGKDNVKELYDILRGEDNE